jgi:methylmalonyl-CoA/ethylmalonyl-CoA epimerase
MRGGRQLTLGGGVKLDSFDHIGHVVKDCEATMKSWSSLLGVEGWRTREVGVLNLAWGSLGGVQVELLQPLDDKSLWAEFLETHGEGLHHVCVRVADVDATAAKLVEEGGEVMISMPGTMAYVNIGGPGSVILELLKTE